MIEDIKNAYVNGRVILFLGAGASYGSQDVDGSDLPMSEALAAELSAAMGWSYSNEPLSTVYSAINNVNSAFLHSLLRKRFTNTRPSDALQKLASFPWPRIFTLNIDDCVEVAIRKQNAQKIQVFSRHAPLEEIDPIFKNVQLIKLNGSADRPEDGFIFSPQEYGQGSTRLPVWYRELGQNYSNYTFVFIGSRLNEPLFQHALAEMRSVLHRAPLRGYVVTPSATEIERHHLLSLNLVHLPGSLTDFSEWMSRAIVPVPTGWDLAVARRPELGNIAGVLSERQKRALNSVTLVSHDSLPRTQPSARGGAIREFYKGYKPTWADIVDGVPAELTFVKTFSEIVRSGHQKRKCISLIGQAGCGKTTALMMTALDVSKNSNRPVYFLREAVSDLKEIVVSLEEINKSEFYLFIDKVESMHNDVVELLSSSSTKNICFVISERLSIWNRRIKHSLSAYSVEYFKVERISKVDSKIILHKLEKFGPWTRLQSLTPESRLAEIYAKSDRQLLIGLMEATTGLGFTQIIRNDFASIGHQNHQKFLVIVGFASIHRATISSNIVGSALVNLGIAEDVNVMSAAVEGIVVSSSAKKFSARHPVYVRELFEKIVPADMIRDCLVAVLEAFSDYEAPVIRNVGKADGVVFKSIINHRFVRQMMRDDERRVRSVYEVFETRFHIDGLYWLQYGLALRGFGNHFEALEKLKTARDAFSSPHIEHAYAQQLMIIASLSEGWDDAEPMLKEAIDILRKLNVGAWENDSYPIVSLAEGHISILLRFLGTETAQRVAQQYANELLVVYKRNPSPRLEEAVNNVVTFATSGAWKEAYGPDYGDEI